MHRKLYTTSPQRLTKRGFLVSVSLTPFHAVFAAMTASLPTPTSLAEALKVAVTKQKPLVVMISLAGCGYCKLVRENYLLPMLSRGELVVVQLDMKSNAALLDAFGNVSTHDQVIRGWGVRLAPTLLFLGRNGIEVADRLVGMNSADFYGAMLDERLAIATRSVR